MQLNKNHHFLSSSFKFSPLIGSFASLHQFKENPGLTAAKAKNLLRTTKLNIFVSHLFRQHNKSIFHTWDYNRNARYLEMSNKIIELQKLFQASTKPLWWRHPRSPYYLYPFYGLLAVAVVAPLLYIPNAVRGIKAKK